MASQLQAIVVGGSSDEFVRNCTSLLDSYGLDIGRCPDVYSTVARLHEAHGGIVVGRFGELCKEDGRLFDIAGACGIACCCLADEGFARKRRALVGAMERGVSVVAEVDEIEEALTRLLGKSNALRSKWQDDAKRGLVGNVIDKILGGATPERSKPDAKSGFSKDEFRMTKAEFDALLGA